MLGSHLTLWTSGDLNGVMERAIGPEFEEWYALHRPRLHAAMFVACRDAVLAERR